jgi:hypothetical protein
MNFWLKLWIELSQTGQAVHMLSALPGLESSFLTHSGIVVGQVEIRTNIA